MNIAFFLIPKREVVCIQRHSTLRQALEKMEYRRYTAVPIIDEQGKYIGTLTEGDLLWKMKHTPMLSFENTHKIKLEEVPLSRHNEAISINAEMEDIIMKAMEQNFVPVVDDKDIFIGIIRRREIIQFCANKLFKYRSSDF